MIASATHKEKDLFSDLVPYRQSVLLALQCEHLDSLPGNGVHALSGRARRVTEHLIAAYGQVRPTGKKQYYGRAISEARALRKELDRFAKGRTGTGPGREATREIDYLVEAIRHIVVVIDENLKN